jgi:Asp-tRNA(Asn)/Glu-tRNA(Gln) amidotransferase A subunit family amidase
MGLPLLTRRQALLAVSSIGLSSTVASRALASQVADAGTVTLEMIQQAEWIAGLELTEEERQATLAGIQSNLDNITTNRSAKIPYDLSPAVHFSADPFAKSLADAHRNAARPTDSSSLAELPEKEKLAFLPVTELAALIRTKQLSSTELTRLYLDRLHEYNDLLKFVVTFTDDLALKQAAKADQEIAAGRYRGPLHGIPWGAKDLMAYPGYPTTWGATPFKDQSFNYKATVAQRLDDAGAVLVAKLTMGALAMGDKSFGQMTRNPWNTDEGSSGSSAGSASAVAAGCVGFAIGTETLGSIISPSRRCGVTGLRPTFGRVSRHGCMTLVWSMDKIGPIARHVEDTALVLDAIHGTDGLDPTVINRPFTWPPKRSLRKLKVGYVKSDSESDDDRRELIVLRGLGVELVPIHLPPAEEVWPACIVLDVECATVFNELTRNKITQDLNEWPNIFRAGEFISGVEYLRAMRIRSQLMDRMKTIMKEVDLYVAGDDLALTNLTGHPSVTIPHGIQTKRGKQSVTSLKFTGRLFGETDLLSVAMAYQRATGNHLETPQIG